MTDILLLEDDESVNRGIEFTLQKAGYYVISAFTISQAKQILKQETEISMLICDVNLPDGNGTDLISHIRHTDPDMHIICLTALDQEMDQVMGYEAGADDYVTKPFSLSVLLLKVNAYFRKQQNTEPGNCIQSGSLEADLDAMKLHRKEEEISLTKNEWKMFSMFVKHPKQILSKAQILEHLFDMEGDFVDENTLAVYIRRLRGKIEEDPSHPQYIKNIRGIGYIWNQPCVRQGGRR